MMMVKSVISHTQRGPYKFKKKKVWVPVEEENSDLEMEIEVIDLSDFSIIFYNNKGKLVLERKQKPHIDICV